MKNKGLALAAAMFFRQAGLFAQEAAVDTTSAGYQIGYQIGSWLPFIIIFTLALLVIIRTFRLSSKDKP
ncbi:hypothetical protein [Phaeodactylibacter luteus]|uniref:Uncharacterized protein n=1 Tax=Phaeodactylibacter luteus TaxID=1564516 RepID=A0A5C6RIY3_9BACT|nr:hypothetical protein [Phaeodactylibacter luteus]TXB62083.1 hypothetical protein FRY97_15710 [Phaeodactylibacter luteus]